MSIFTNFQEIVKQDVPLAKYTWYGLGGNAEYFAAELLSKKGIDPQLATKEQKEKALQSVKEEATKDIPVIIVSVRSQAKDIMTDSSPDKDRF